MDELGEPPKADISKRSWLILLSFLPLLLFVGMRSFPDVDRLFDAPVFHFYIVTFTSFAALVIALFVASAIDSDASPHVFFLTVGFASIAAFFLLHALATPGIVIADFNQAVGWSARISLLSGAILFALSAIEWRRPLAERLMNNRVQVWFGCGFIYLAYIVIAIWFSGVLEQLSAMEPWINYGLSGLTILLYLWAAWQSASRPRPGRRQFWTIVSVSLILLAQAQVSMTLGPLWHLSWWLYHLLMLVSFLLAVGAIAIEYEALTPFRATRYFAALGSLAALGLALLSGWVTSNILGTPSLELPIVTVALSVATLLFIILFFIVRRADRMIRERTAALRREQTLREDLTRLVVHDLKNPLAAIVANLSAIKGDENWDQLSTSGGQLDSAIQSAGDLQRLLQDMLDYDRLEGGVLSPRYELVWLPDLLRERTKIIQGRLQQYDQTLRLDLADHNDKIAVDPDLIARVIDNLLSNAIKFSGVGGFIQLASYQHESNVHIKVSDSGPGIPPMDRERVFDRYFRGDTSRRGAGLGLSFCRLAVEVHDGQIWVERSSEGGACFHFTLPVEQGDADNDG